jgi:hypothetical protein
MTDIYKSDKSDKSPLLLLHKDINSYIYEGGNVSHILSVNIYQPITDDIKNQISQHVFNKINNIPIMFNINNIDVIITWHSNTVSNYYHADVGGIYGDTAVKLHTEMLLKMFDMSTYKDSLVTIIKKDYSWSILDFIITKPLVRTIPI